MTEKEWLKIRDDLGYIVWSNSLNFITDNKNMMELWDRLPQEQKQLHISAAQAAAVHGLNPLNKRRRELIHKQNHGGGLTEKEQAIFEELDEVFGQCIDKIHPRSPGIEFSDHIKALIKEMEGG